MCGRKCKFVTVPIRVYGHQIRRNRRWAYLDSCWSYGWPAPAPRDSELEFHLENVSRIHLFPRAFKFPHVVLLILPLTADIDFKDLRFQPVSIRIRFDLAFYMLSDMSQTLHFLAAGPYTFAARPEKGGGSTSRCPAPLTFLIGLGSIIDIFVHR